MEAITKHEINKRVNKTYTNYTWLEYKNRCENYATEIKKTHNRINIRDVYTESKRENMEYWKQTKRREEDVTSYSVEWKQSWKNLSEVLNHWK